MGQTFLWNTNRTRSASIEPMNPLLKSRETLYFIYVWQDSAPMSEKCPKEIDYIMCAVICTD